MAVTTVRRRLLFPHLLRRAATYEPVPPPVYRTFDGINDNLQSASTIDLSAVNKCALVFWLWWDAFAVDNDCALGFTAAPTSTAGAFYLNLNPDAAFMACVCLGDVGFNRADYARVSAAAWHQWVVVYDFSQATNEVDLYIDSVLQTPSDRPFVNNNTGNFADDLLNVMCLDGASLFGAGRMARLGIIPGEIPTQAQVDDLFAGRLLTELFPNAYYWPIKGTSSPEPAEDIYGIALTVNG